MNRNRTNRANTRSSGITFSLSALTLAAVLVTPSLDGRSPPPYQVLLASLQTGESVVPDYKGLNPLQTVYNEEAPIPPQCYTRTEGVHNPCYVCHQNAIPQRENVMNDGHLQVAYSFSDAGTRNHWQNLFVDRSESVRAISDDDILDWVAHDNYSELAERLQHAGFKGWMPDLKGLQQGAAAFDRQGFARDGSHWVAFNYKPFPSTFWPTNGSTDDVMIRLPEAFRTNAEGNYSRDVYAANLAITEARLKGFERIGSLPVDEREVGVDLNLDGELSVVTEIARVQRYVGAAAPEFNDSYLYPEGTEFLHTVRYLGFDEDGQVVPSTRMKEVRYMKKWVAYRKSVYARNYQLEQFDKEAGALPQYTKLGHRGLDNKNGWAVQSFIEGHDGRLRSATLEENMFCMGCHTSVGATIDKTFSFPRKVDGAAGWGYIDLTAMQDAPSQGETQGEILTYFERAGGGDEFRSNTELMDRFFNADGTVNRSEVAAADTVYDLITPSYERAMQLNKAYRVIVEQQSYLFGRDATTRPPKNVYEAIDNDTAPTLKPEHVYAYDIRLDWGEG